MKDLQIIRQELDDIDKELITLFEKRFSLSEEVARYKLHVGKKVYDKERELEKIAAIKQMITREELKDTIEEVFVRILDLSKLLQYRKIGTEGNDQNEFSLIDTIEKENSKVVYQGVPGAYSYEAMHKVFGDQVDCFNVEYFKDAMSAIKEGKADYAVLPIENSTAGIVSEIYDLLVEFDNYIVDATSIKIEHALLGLEGASLVDIKTVYSHPQGLMQCRDFLEEHKDWKQIAQYNTARSAIKVSEEKDKSQAAIASTASGELYGLKVLQEHISMCDENTTKFIIISNKKVFTKEADKIMVCFELPHESGSLYRLLSHFIYNNLNMTKIESRPIPNIPWEYRFFVEFEGNLQDTQVKIALNAIREEAISFKLLGNY